MFSKRVTNNYCFSKTRFSCLYRLPTGTSCSLSFFLLNIELLKSLNFVLLYNSNLQRYMLIVNYPVLFFHFQRKCEVCFNTAIHCTLFENYGYFTVGVKPLLFLYFTIKELEFSFI